MDGDGRRASPPAVSEEVVPDGTPPTRRRFLGVAAGAVGGAVVGGGAVAAVDPRAPRSTLDRVTEDDLDVGSRPLRNAIELAGATNSGQGIHRIIWSVPTTEKVMALSFDDGPDVRFTPRIIATLEKYGIVANFNCMGYNARRNPDLVREHVRRGDQIGNHTMLHKDLAFETLDGIRDEITQAAKVIEGISGVPITLFRPPRGVMTGQVAAVTAEMSYDLFLWTVMVSHHPGGSRDELLRRARKGFEPGSVVSLHDGVGRGTFFPEAEFAKQLVDAREMEVALLPEIIEAGLDAGFRWVTVAEMLASAGLPARS